MQSTAYLSLGSNLGDREQNLLKVVDKLRKLVDVTRVSSLYETEPVEFTDQPWFLNCAVAIVTDLTPQRLMAHILEVEREMGRERTAKKGPRTVDIDVLLFGDAVVATPGLTVPHPAMHQRRFVLEPLAEIAPNAWHPVLKKTVEELCVELRATEAVRKFRDGGWADKSRAI